GGGEAWYFGRLLVGEAAEVPELHDTHLPRIDRAEPIERLADGEHLVVRLGEVDARHVTLDPLNGAAALERAAPSAVVHQQPPHGLGGDREELRAILPVAV